MNALVLAQERFWSKEVICRETIAWTFLLGTEKGNCLRDLESQAAFGLGGTGCRLATAIAWCLSKEKGLPEAVKNAETMCMDTFKGSQDAEKRSENGSAAQRLSNQFLCAGLIAERFRRLADCLVRIRGFVAQGKKGGNGIGRKRNRSISLPANSHRGFAFGFAKE